MERELVQRLRVGHDAKVRRPRRRADVDRGARYVCEFLPQLGRLLQHRHRIGDSAMATTQSPDPDHGPLPEGPVLAHVVSGAFRRTETAPGRLRNRATIWQQNGLLRPFGHRDPRRGRARHRRLVRHALLPLGHRARVCGPRRRQARPRQRHAALASSRSSARCRHVRGAAGGLAVARKTVLQLDLLLFQVRAPPTPGRAASGPLPQERRRRRHRSQNARTSPLPQRRPRPRQRRRLLRPRLPRPDPHGPRHRRPRRTPRRRPPPLHLHARPRRPRRTLRRLVICQPPLPQLRQVARPTLPLPRLPQPRPHHRPPPLTQRRHQWARPLQALLIS
mmetsp:Transcript_1029/g.2947  ORF Transcript_1029/g.2947 Transcript_1029/m.2947 type:complete len:334 (-) Transcript_1029:11-1012(-)